MRLRLESERLKLRPFDISDAENMFNTWASDNEVTKYLTWNAHISVEDTKSVLNLWINQYEKLERINCAIVLKSNNLLIGGIDVVGYLDGVPVLGYVISRNHWNKGYATEACKCLLEHLFNQGHKVVRIDAVAENIGSNRVIQKCGGMLINVIDDYVEAKDCIYIINQYEVYAEQFYKQLKIR